MNAHEQLFDLATGAAAGAQGAMHEQMPQQREFPKRAEHDIVAKLHQATTPEGVTPKPEIMSEAPDVSAIAFTSHPNAATGTYAYGYNKKFGIVTPYENASVAMPTALEDILQTRSLQYGRKAVTDDGHVSGKDIYGYADTNSGEAFLFKGSFHGSLENDDPAERRTIVSFAASNSRLSDNRRGTSCTFVVEGDHAFDEVLEIAREKFPGIMGPLEAPVKEGDSPRSGKPVDIKLSNTEPIELGEQLNDARGWRSGGRTKILSPESSVRTKVRLLEHNLQSAYDIARLHNTTLSDQELADRVMKASEWRIKYTANDAELTPDSVQTLAKELQSALTLPRTKEAQDKWETDHGISYEIERQVRNEEDDHGMDWKAVLKRNAETDKGENRVRRWGKNIGKYFGFELGDGSDQPKAPRVRKPKRQKQPEASDVDRTLDEFLGEPEEDLFGDNDESGYDEPADTVATTEENADNVSAVKVHTQKDRKTSSKLKSLHAAFMNRATEMQIGSADEKYNRRLRRGLGAVAVAAVGVAGAYLAMRGGMHFSFGGNTVGHGLAPGANGELVPSTGGIGQQLPSDIPQTPSTQFGTEIMPSGGTGAVTPPDHIPAPSTSNVPPTPTGIPSTPNQVPTTPPQTPGHIPASPMGTPDQIPGTPQVPTPDVPKPGAGPFDPNAIGITTPDINMLPAGEFHLQPGQSLSEYIRGQMPHASTNAVYNEVARIMQANHMPVNWSAPDPFTAARHIRPGQALHTR